MDIKIIIDFLNHSDTHWDYRSPVRINNEFDIQPNQFLIFAELDLTAPYEHNLINALSNAKRALDSQIDTLLLGFDFYLVAKNNMWGFPKKIELIQKLGILAPRVLKKINTTRNLMEHQFVKPKQEMVEDFVDIVSLFLASTDKYIYELPGDCELVNEILTDFWLQMSLELTAHKLSLSVKSNNQVNFTKDYKSADADYLPLLKGYLKAGYNY